MTTASAIRTEGLVKRYGRLTAVDHVDLDVRDGDLFGFLGPNGSGKTTTIRMLLGLVHASAGAIELLGHPVPGRVRMALPRVGTLVEGPGFYPHVSGRRNLAIFDAAGPRRPYASSASRGRRIRAALERVGLADVGRRPVRAYSLGMRQRLGLAAALLRRPRLVVLDEPTNGLDPQGIHEIRSLFLELVAEGTTVFLSSHQLAEVELLCTRAAMMANGRLVAQDTVASLLAPTGRVRLTTPDGPLAEAVVRSMSGPQVVGAPAGGVRAIHGGTELVVQLDGLPPERLNHELVSGGVRVRELVIERPTLEQVFLTLTADRGVTSPADPLSSPTDPSSVPPLPPPPGTAPAATVRVDAPVEVTAEDPDAAG